jgi:hypothetical protein
MSDIIDRLKGLPDEDNVIADAVAEITRLSAALTLEREAADEVTAQAFALGQAKEQGACYELLMGKVRRLIAGRNRVNQVDQHVAQVLSDAADEIIARHAAAPTSEEAPA